MPARLAIIDGEVVVQTATGVASFPMLVDALKNGGGDMLFYGFDLLYLDGHDLREAPLVARKQALAALLAETGSDRIRYSDHIAGDGDAVFRHASRLGLEGIISKQAAAPYRSGRVKTWLKVKSSQSDSFVIAGFVPSTVDRQVGGRAGAGRICRQPAGAGRPLRLGLHRGERARAVAAARSLAHHHAAAEGRDGAAQRRALGRAGAVGRDRVSRPHRRRADTPRGVPRARRRQGRQRPAARSRAQAEGQSQGRSAELPVRLTNPGRLLWPDQGITKQGLAEFYGEIADWILPHLVGRPLSLLRHPEGIDEKGFFQKHAWAGLSDRVRQVPVPNDEQPMLVIDDLAGLLELVQASVLEIHPWGAKADRPELPDRVTIDLDPGDNVPWQRVIDAAHDVRRRLAALKLESFVKTTGGKGLHVVFPLTPQAQTGTP